MEWANKQAQIAIDISKSTNLIFLPLFRYKEERQNEPELSKKKQKFWDNIYAKAKTNTLVNHNEELRSQLNNSIQIDINSNTYSTTELLDTTILLDPKATGDHVIPDNLNSMESGSKGNNKRLMRRKSELPQDAQTQRALNAYNRHDDKGLNKIE